MLLEERCTIDLRAESFQNFIRDWQSPIVVLEEEREGRLSILTK